MVDEKFSYVTCPKYGKFWEDENDYEWLRKCIICPRIHLCLKYNKKESNEFVEKWFYAVEKISSIMEKIRKEKNESRLNQIISYWIKNNEKI